MKTKAIKLCALLLAAVVLMITDARAGAVRPGFNATTLAANDDGSTGLVDLGFSINFFGQTYSRAYVNNNGNITFDGALSDFTPFDLNQTAHVILAPFFGDVDTRGSASELVRYSFGVERINGRLAFGVNWINVGYYSARTDKLNSFQLVIIDRSDRRVGDFDFEFNYDKLQWEAGEADNGILGLGGRPARAGYANGKPGSLKRSLELVGSGASGAFLDTNRSSGLIYNSLGSSVPGRYVFVVNGGDPSSPPVANAGSPQGAVRGETVNLDASASNSPQGFPLTFQWTQTSGPAVSLADANTSRPSFTVPAVEGALTFRVEVRDNRGGAATSSATVTIRTVATKPASSVSGTSATLNGAVNPAGAATSVYFEYGTSTSYGSVTPTQTAGSGTAPSAFSAALTGLVDGQTYHFRAVSVSGRITIFGLDLSFTASSLQLPIIVSQSSTGITTTAGILHASVNPNRSETAVRFEYGTDVSFGTATVEQTIPTGNAPSEVTQAVTGLTPRTTYYWRTIARHGTNLAFGTAQTFVTLGGTDSPIARDDRFSVANRAEFQTLSVLANDEGAGPLTITATSTPGAGIVEIENGGSSLRYRPDARFRGEDTFTYTINNTSGPPSTATVTLRGRVLAGTYVGLVADVDDDGGGADGHVVLTVTAAGSFTGRMWLAGYSGYVFSGVFDSSGNYSATVSNPSIAVPRVPLILHVEPAPTDANPGDYRITGSVRDNGILLETSHSAYVRATPLVEAGKYTVLLNANPPADVSIPQGTGYATLTVGATGAARIVGRLADDAPFSVGATIVGDGGGGRQFVLFDPKIYSYWGLLSGRVRFADVQGSDCVGTFSWVRGPLPRSQYFATGFEFNTQLIGARYKAPAAGELAIPLPQGTASVVVSAGGLTSAFSVSASLSSDQKVTVGLPNPQDLKFTISPSFGTYFGSFIHPVSNKRTKVRGALYQHPDAPKAAGYFLGPVVSGVGLSGKLLLAPPL